MDGGMIILILLAAVLVAMGVVILAGKGDNLIAGYNTSSKEEQEKYDIKKLRLLIGGLLIVIAPAMFLLTGEPSTSILISFPLITVVLAIIVVILANTWARKK